MTRPCSQFLLAAAFTFAPLQAADDRIRRVETSLTTAVQIEGRPAPAWSVAERQRVYNTPAASVAVVENYRIAWARAWGAGAAPETLFQAASISKPVAALVALRLVEQGKLSLDEDVNLKLKSWKVPENEFTKTEKVTLRRLLSHTAGLTVHGFRGYAKGEKVPTLVELLNGAPPANSAAIKPDLQPGSRWRYSGGGYSVMQQLIIEVTGEPFESVAERLVLRPLGMKRSTYRQPLPEAWRKRAAVGYRGDGKPVPGDFHTYPEMAAAGLWTTPSDLARFILEIQRPKLLKSATVQTMLTEVRDRYGLGLGVRGAMFSHGGANEGFRCMLVGFRDGKGAVVMTNGDRGSALGSEILRSISAAYGWTEYRPDVKKTVSLPRATLEQYAGEYDVPGNRRAAVTVRDGYLRLEVSGAAGYDLWPESETKFFSLEREIPDPTFTRLPGGAIEFSAGGYTTKKR
jgi:CubicO group peptidase (beta-lactamase class C family)